MSEASIGPANPAEERSPAGSRLGRRALLAAAGLGALSACGGAPSEVRPSRGPSHPASPPGSAGPRPRYLRRVYGADPDVQYGVLGIPAVSPLGTVVVIHGGSWRAGANIGSIVPLAAELTARGYYTWMIEYRTIGNGGGFPDTLLDVGRAVDHLRALDQDPSIAAPGLLDHVTVLGHSAGAQLAVWEASRRAAVLGTPPQVRLDAAVSLAGPLVFDLALRSPLLRTLIEDFLGGTPAQQPRHYALADPAQLLPATVPVWAVTGTSDVIVPPAIAQRYVALAKAAGGRATEVAVPATHTTIISTSAPSLTGVLGAVTAARGAA